MMNQLHLNQTNLFNYIRPTLALPLVWITLWLIIISTLWPQINFGSFVGNYLTVEGFIPLLENLLQMM